MSVIKKVSNEVTSEVDELKSEANKMVQNLSAISSRVTDTTMDSMTKLADNTLERIHTELQDYREKLDKVRKSAQRTLFTVDKKVKSNPYPYIAGSIGIGLLLGKLFRPASE